MSGQRARVTHQLPFLANCSMLFCELPLLQRPAAAKAAEFDAIELWWPFASPVPGDDQIEALIAAIQDAGVRLIGLNFFAGDLAGPDCGVLSIPARAQQFSDNVPVAVEIGERLGVRVFNALYGNRVDGVSAAEQDELGIQSLVAAAQAARAIGATVLVEAVSGPKPYPLRRAADAIAVVQRARALGAQNVSFLCDLYHLAANGEDLGRVLRDCASMIGHVQIADLPGRGEPGSGTLDIDGHLTLLAGEGYDGWVGLEYRPTSTTLESLAWLPPQRRAAGVAALAAAQRTREARR
jgi:hydroxypyruvate isomerase